MRVITAILAALFLVGCGGRSINFGNNEDLKVAIYHGGSVTAEGAVGRASPSATELKRVVSDPAVEWKPSMVTYAPELFFRNSEIEILLLKQTMVLESSDGTGHFSQSVAPLDASEFEKIRGLAIKDLGAKSDN